ncbi:endoglucanase 8-like [Camellia sinensis]|uniref:endoglucanase 8-like n=1 Tax=Camellia sinensis TaxID=4442 RepID=UPI0010367B83|nr:endoglucanase 8-like [Camellia sinensis]
MMMVVNVANSQDYGEALTKSLLFFEGQRSGKLPPSQRITWRKDSALLDGSDLHVDLVGGYYDAGDNVKFHFPMAYTTTMLAWGVLEFGEFMGSDLQHTHEAIRWATDYFLKATSVPGDVYAQVGNPYGDHNCWERPEDMETPRTTYAMTENKPGSEVSAEIAAALAASSMVFYGFDRRYSKLFLRRASKVFLFADKFRGSYNDGLGPAVCPFYCSGNGYQDELIWAAAWLHKATKATYYWNYVTRNVHSLDSVFAEFGWDAKHAGINILLSKSILSKRTQVCSVLPESPTKSVTYSPGGLLLKPGGGNMQHVTTLSFLLIVYSRYLYGHGNMSIVHCDNVAIKPARLVHVAKGQVLDYILGNNPSSMSYMVGYGNKFLRYIHHRGSSLPSIDKHPEHINYDDGRSYFASNQPNPILLIGAIVRGPNINDSYNDSRADLAHSEPTTYINAPVVVF